MSSSVLLLALLLVLVVALVAGQLSYVAYRHPAAVTPMLVGLAAVTVLVGVVMPVVVR
ncbi:hypothetical protein [Streptomyces sp. ID05-18]|uniref:hypothetical protein n=1 Tax=Streptomyces sp. ID05-18 TaxID=3028662 RepID=UPI0029A1DE39|nr:hypothetical protein [Streptomyces sp. ID05-18]MDX3490977.1 hypothetical protein [Streptomyces sp. ID05-18]